MKKRLLILLLLLVVQSAHADWTAVDTVTSPGVMHYFDAESLQKNGSFRKIWILSSYDEQQKGGYHAIKTFYEFDCAHHKARPITVLLYPDKTASKAVIGARHDESTDWSGFSDDSIFHQVSTVVCAPSGSAD